MKMFWSNVKKTPKCWVWTGTKFNEYGCFYILGKSFRAHRFSWVLKNGPIKYGLWVCHKCDNPPCVRPSHLFLGTRADNMRDAFKKGRLPKIDGRLKTHCKRGHEFTKANIIVVKIRDTGRTGRACLACSKQYKKRKK